jgi:hypothetical protein
VFNLARSALVRVEVDDYARGLGESDVVSILWKRDMIAVCVSVL